MYMAGESVGFRLPGHRNVGASCQRITQLLVNGYESFKINVVGTFSPFAIAKIRLSQHLVLNAVFIASYLFIRCLPIQVTSKVFYARQQGRKKTTSLLALVFPRILALVL